MEEKKNPKPSTRRGRKPKTTRQKVKENEQIDENLEKQEESSSQKASTLEESVNYLKKVGLKKVSNKTFINEEDLISFLEGDFTHINKTKALGFIKILEREYPVNLQELRQAYISYYQQNRQKRKERLVVEAQSKDNNIWKKYLVWIAPLVLFLIAAIIYILSENNSLSELESGEKVILHDSNSEIIQEAKKNLVKLEENGSYKKTSAKTSSETKTAEILEDEGENDLDLDAMVKQMVKEYNLSVEASLAAIEDEENLSQKQSNEKREINQTEKEVAQTNMTQRSLSEKNGSISGKKTSVTVKSTAPKKSKTKNRLYIKPVKKCWVGIIYLDNFTKKDFLIKSSFKFDTTRPQLIVVGHKYFEIFNNGYSYRFRGQGPIRFIYKNGNIMQINKREFLVYSKGVNW